MEKELPQGWAESRSAIATAAEPPRRRNSSVGGRPRQPIKDGSIVVRSLSRGLRIIGLFTPEHPEWSLDEIVDATGFPKATAYRLVRTLETERFLTFERSSNAFCLGPSLLPCTILLDSYSELVRVVKPYLQTLMERTGETAYLVVQAHTRSITVDVVYTPRPFKPVMHVGHEVDDLASASGKVFLAFSPEEQRQQFLAWKYRRSELHKQDLLQLQKELQQVAQEGVAYDFGEYFGVCAVAAPIWNARAEVRGALVVVAPVERGAVAEMEKHAEIVRDIAESISSHLGHSSERHLGPQ
jgi:DNA-binding IclR family transcriptional regulator